MLCPTFICAPWFRGTVQSEADARDRARLLGAASTSAPSRSLPPGSPAATLAHVASRRDFKALDEGLFRGVDLADLPDAVRTLEAEGARRRAWDRVFPLEDQPTHYLDLFEAPRFSNLLLSKWLGYKQRALRIFGSLEAAVSGPFGPELSNGRVKTARSTLSAASSTLNTPRSPLPPRKITSAVSSSARGAGVGVSMSSRNGTLGAGAVSSVGIRHAPPSAISSAKAIAAASRDPSLLGPRPSSPSTLTPGKSLLGLPVQNPPGRPTGPTSARGALDDCESPSTPPCRAADGAPRRPASSLPSTSSSQTPTPRSSGGVSSIRAMPVRGHREGAGKASALRAILSPRTDSGRLDPEMGAERPTAGVAGESNAPPSSSGWHRRYVSSTSSGSVQQIGLRAQPLSSLPAQRDSFRPPVKSVSKIFLTSRVEERVRLRSEFTSMALRAQQQASAMLRSPGGAFGGGGALPGPRTPARSDQPYQSFLTSTGFKRESRVAAESGSNIDRARPGSRGHGSVTAAVSGTSPGPNDG